MMDPDIFCAGIRDYERASSTLLKVVAFDSRSFTSHFAVFSSLRPVNVSLLFPQRGYRIKKNGSFIQREIKKREFRRGQYKK